MSNLSNRQPGVESAAARLGGLERHHFLAVMADAQASIDRGWALRKAAWQYYRDVLMLPPPKPRGRK